jgi:hypothetical protein
MNITDFRKLVLLLPGETLQKLNAGYEAWKVRAESSDDTSLNRYMIWLADLNADAYDVPQR